MTDASAPAQIFRDHPVDLTHRAKWWTGRIAVYGVLMFPLAAAFGLLITRGSAAAQPSRSSE